VLPAIGGELAKLIPRSTPSTHLAATAGSAAPITRVTEWAKENGEEWGLNAFYERRLKEPYPDLNLDARYERYAVLIAIGVDWEDRRQVLAVDLFNRERPRPQRRRVRGGPSRWHHRCGVEECARGAR
jgi:hypothetical protein